MIRQIGALAWNTFREAVRDRVLYSIFFFGLGVVLLSLALEDIAIGDQAKVVRSVAQGAIDLFASIIAIFLGISLVWKELERRTIYTILSKPISRWTFILGKYFGLILTLAVQLILMVVVYVLMMVLEPLQGFPEPVVFVSMLLVFVEVISDGFCDLVQLLLCTHDGVVFAISIFVIGHLADDIWLYGSQADSESIQQMARALYWVLPNSEIFNLREAAVHGQPVPWQRVGMAAVYGLSYTALVLAAAIGIFQRKDIK